jgi:hypothetical protein
LSETPRPAILRLGPEIVVPFTRDDIRASIERAGDDQWRALIAHHEDPYPRPTPTPGDVCRAEAQRLNAMEWAGRPGLELVESRVSRVGDEVELVHRFRNRADGSELWTQPFRNYAPGPASPT